MKFEAIAESTLYNKLNAFALNFYRDENGCDRLCKGNLSYGQLIGSAAVVFFASIYKEYYSLGNRLKSGERIAFNEKEHPIRLMIQKSFGERLIDNRLPVINDVLDRQHSHVPGYTRLSKYLSLLQAPMRFFEQSCKSLYLSDWTYRTLEGNIPGARFVNSRNLFRGAYLYPSKRYLGKAYDYLPSTIHKADISKMLHEYSKLNMPLPDDLLELFAQYIVLYYDTNRPFFGKVLGLYEELLDRYSPESVYLPGELYEPYILIRALCADKDIKTHLMIDGFSLLSYYPNLKVQSGDDFIFNQYVAFGAAQVMDYKKKGLNSEKIEMRRWPVFDKYDVAVQYEKKYDCMVMSWIPLNTNPEADLQSPSITMLDVVRVLKRKGYLEKKIAIKIKSSSELKYVSDLIQQENISADILTGMLYEHLPNVKMIIGGISSAVAEARYCDIPYYIYEPVENGYPDTVLLDSSVVTKSLVARTIEELEYNLDHRQSFLLVDKKNLIYNTN
ncbi:MAG: hypothetical protein H7Y13_07860 [Sphingobacteriaceae bacterium]|nr:hypothetical protein [Sphingobacteriaceae bacterium]